MCATWLLRMPPLVPATPLAMAACGWPLRRAWPLSLTTCCLTACTTTATRWVARAVWRVCARGARCGCMSCRLTSLTRPSISALPPVHPNSRASISWLMWRSRHVTSRSCSRARFASMWVPAWHALALTWRAWQRGRTLLSSDDAQAVAVQRSVFDFVLILVLFTPLVLVMESCKGSWLVTAQRAGSCSGGRKRPLAGWEEWAAEGLRGGCWHRDGVLMKQVRGGGSRESKGQGYKPASHSQEEQVQSQVGVKRAREGEPARHLHLHGADAFLFYAERTIGPG